MSTKYSIQVYDFDGEPLRLIPVGDDVTEVVKRISTMEAEDNGYSYKMVKNKSK